VLLGVRGERDRTGQPALVGERPVHQAAHGVVVERLEGEQHAPRQQRRDHREVRVLGGRGEQRDVRSSTAASSESCCVLLNRCTSSMNSTVGAPPARRCAARRRSPRGRP
jgi:hypothetical protein